MADFQMKTVDGTPVRRAPSPEVPRGNLGVAEHLGRASIGQAVSQTGQALASYAEKERKAREAAAMADARREMMTGVDKDLSVLGQDLATAQIDQDFSEEDFLDQASTVIGERAEAIRSQDGLSREAERQLAFFAEQYQAKAMSQAQTMFRKTRADRLQSKFIEAADAAYAMGDIEAGDAELDRMVKAGLEYPEEIERRKRKGRNFAHVEQAKRDMLADPIGALDTLKDGGYSELDSSQKLQLTRQAEVRVNKERSDRQEDYVSRIESGELIAESEIEDDVEAGLLTKSQARAISNRQKGTSFDPVAYADLMGRVGSYNPAEDKSGTEYAELLGEILGMPSGTSTELRSKLNKRAEGEAQSDPLSAASKELSNLHSDHFFSGGIPARTPEQMLESSESYLAMQTALDRIAKAKPDATSEELLTLALREPEAAKIRSTERAKVIGESQPIQTTEEERKSAAKANRLILIRSQFPSIDSSMGESEAIRAAARDSGGSLSPEQVRDIRMAVKAGL